MTEQIKRKLQDEINTLEHELIHELPKEIKKAAALGDLSENAEYHMAKQRQEFVKARVRQLGKRLADLSMVNMNNIPKDRVGLGSTVKVYDNTKNEEVEYKLVTSEESDVEAGKISTTSPRTRKEPRLNSTSDRSYCSSTSLCNSASRDRRKPGSTNSSMS